MKDSSRTSSELIKEISVLKQRIQKLEQSDITERKRAEERYRSIFENAQEGILQTSDEGRFLTANRALATMLGYDSPEDLMTTVIDIPKQLYVNPDDRKALLKMIEEQGSVRGFETQFYRKNGSMIWVSVNLQAVRDAGGRVLYYEGFKEDITDRKRAEEALQRSEERYRTLVENASDIVFRTDDTGHFTFINPATLRITGYEEKEMIGKHCSTLIRPDMLDETVKFFGRQLVKGIQNTYLEYSIITKDGHEIWLGQNTQLIAEDGHVVGFQAVARDIMDSKRTEAEILALSITDHLTGLHNRRGFLSLAGQQLKLAERNKSGMLLFFADLDGLKWINDTLGHEEGDKALIETATVLKETFRTSDIIARLGGDEYAAFTVNITEENSEILTARLQSQIDTRNNQENRRYRLSISVGCSYYDPENPCSIDELMASADKWMYEQKQNKKGLLLQGASLSSSNPYPSRH